MSMIIITKCLVLIEKMLYNNRSEKARKNIFKKFFVFSVTFSKKICIISEGTRNGAF